MVGEPCHVVTGAFGFSGRYIAQRLLDAGIPVRTLTNSPARENPFGERVPAHPLAFDAPDRLVKSLRGAAVLYNTYWVRFNHSTFRHADAVTNTRTLFDAARQAGVRRIVHVSITNPSESSPLEYFSGKAVLEQSLRETGLPHSVLRPAVLFGPQDVLVNNIAWVLRRFPVFLLLGDGSYRIQPIYVDDCAELAVREGFAAGARVIDAIGPQTFTFRELVAEIARILGVRRRIVAAPPWLGLSVARLVGWWMDDVILTRDEVVGLTTGLLATGSPPAGRTRLTDWARAHSHELGLRYASELARRRDRHTAYERL